MKILGFDAPAVTRLAEYYFRDELFQFAPDAVLEAIAAHELAHAPDSLRAFEAGVSSINLPPRDPPKKGAVSRAVQQVFEWNRVYFIESRVWETVRQWGFDQGAAVEWCEGNLD